MRLVHLSDLHLGFRAFPRVERGWNLRERDLAGAFRRAVQDVVSLEPDLVLITGDLFDRPDPPSTAVLTLVRGLDTLRRGLPRAPILVIAGERDTPLNPADPGPVAALDSLPRVEAAAGAARAVRLRKAGVHALLVPHRAVLRPPFPDLRPDPAARWNLLLIRGSPSAEPDGAEVDPSGWSYVAVGGGHRARSFRDAVWCAGSLERVGWDPWREATEEKGFVVYDLERESGELHPVSARPVVDLAPVRTSGEDVEAGTRRLRNVLKGVPGGIHGKIVRVRLLGDLLSPEEGVAHGLLAAVRARTAHVELLLLGAGREDVDAAPRPGAGPEAPATIRAGPLTLAPGITAVTGPDPGVRRRAALELGAAPPGADGGWVGPSDILWAGDRDPGRMVREGVPLLLAAGGEVGRGGKGGKGTGPRDPTRSGRSEQDGPRALEQELARIRADAMEAAGEMEAGNLEWARDRQEAESRLIAYRDRARELRTRIRELEREGAEAPCPTCGRPVGKELGALLQALRDEWEAVVQDGRWWKRRRKQMEDKPEDLRRLERAAWTLQARLESMAERVEPAGEGRPREEKQEQGPSDPSDPGVLPVNGSPDPKARETLRRLLRRAGSLAHRLTEGSVGGILWEEGGLRILGSEGPSRAPIPEEEPVLAFSVHLALWCLAREEGRRLNGIVLGELAGEGNDALAARALELAGRVVAGDAAVLLVVPPAAVERVPEAVGRLLAVAEGPSGLEYGERPSGRPRISLV